jgi:predicted nucleotidyltransferase
MFTKESAINYTKEFLKSLEISPIKINKAILFGSVITGHPNEDSDIDLALFSEDFSDNILKNLGLIAAFNVKFPEIDVHTYPVASYNKEGFLLDEIKKTGFEIAV